MSVASIASAVSGANINPRTEEAAPKSTAALSSDFETFLRMLTVQLQNQDPLNPVEASDYAVQLATFSGVEQQVRTNDLLSALGDQLNLMGLGQFAGWVGMEARFTGPVGFSGTPIDYIAAPDRSADSAFVVVRDAQDNIVDRRPIPIAGGTLSWDGTDAAGTAFPPGQYHLFIESMSAGIPVSTAPAEVFDLVTEASVIDGQTMIGLASGHQIAATGVSGLRAP